MCACAVNVRKVSFSRMNWFPDISGPGVRLFPNANRTAKPNRACGIRRTEPELEFALLELKRTELRTNKPSTRAQRPGCLPFLEKFFFEMHIGSSSDVLSSPGVLFKSCLVPLLDASQMGFELYPIALLLCDIIE